MTLKSPILTATKSQACSTNEHRPINPAGRQRTAASLFRLPNHWGLSGILRGSDTAQIVVLSSSACWSSRCWGCQLFPRLHCIILCIVGFFHRLDPPARVLSLWNFKVRRTLRRSHTVVWSLSLLRAQQAMHRSYTCEGRMTLFAASIAVPAIYSGPPVKSILSSNGRVPSSGNTVLDGPSKVRSVLLSILS